MSGPTQALLSFAYGSCGPTNSPDGAPVLKFDNSGKWKMGLGTDMAAAGSGAFPTGNFYLRGLGVTVLGGAAGNWVMVGHSGPNGDWTAPPVLPGRTDWFTYPEDAAPLFTAGEYFDAHVAFSDSTIEALIGFWWTPAP